MNQNNYMDIAMKQPAKEQSNILIKLKKTSNNILNKKDTKKK